MSAATGEGATGAGPHFPLVPTAARAIGWNCQVTGIRPNAVALALRGPWTDGS
jgi:hypothetical protein